MISNKCHLVIDNGYHGLTTLAQIVPAQASYSPGHFFSEVMGTIDFRGKIMKYIPVTTQARCSIAGLSALVIINEVGGSVLECKDLISVLLTLTDGALHYISFLPLKSNISQQIGGTNWSRCHK